jgi:5'-3' exonuclease
MRPTTEVKDSKRVLIVDALNMFLRAYTIIPSMNPQGLPNGGTIGFIKSLQKLCRNFKPHEVIICWDGHGGSEKRRQQNKQYKQGRRPVRFNRRMIDLSEDKVKKNRTDQQLRLHEYLNNMPVIQLMVDFVEADDIIALVVKHDKYKDYNKIIVSSDKDFYQLLGDDSVFIHRPSAKVITDPDYLINGKMLLHKSGIHPNNYALARAIDGDKSDNIDGVPRIGMKTIQTNLPILESSEQISCDDLFVHCKMQIKPKNIHKKLLEFQERVKSNYSIMQLYESNISYNGRRSINYNIDNFEYGLNKLEIQKMLISDGQGQLNLSDLWTAFKQIKP